MAQSMILSSRRCATINVPSVARVMQHQPRCTLWPFWMRAWAQQGLPAVGFEPYGLVPEASALDHSAKLSCCPGSPARV